MRTNAPDESPGDGLPWDELAAGGAAACGGCGRPLAAGAALCTGCGTRADGGAVTTRVVEASDTPPVADGSADRGPNKPSGSTVRGAGADDERVGLPTRWLGLGAAAVVALFAVLLLAWGFRAGGPLSSPVAARAVRVLPLFDAGGRLLLVHRDEVAASGPGAAVVVELDPSVVGGGRPELVPTAGGVAAAGVPLGPAAGPVRIDLAPLSAAGPPNLLPVRPPDRFFERPAPEAPTRLEATATYEAGGFEGRLRLATGGERPVAAEGRVTAANEGDPSLAAAMVWDGAALAVEPASGVSAGWAGPGGDAWLFVLPDGAPPAEGAYEVRVAGETLGRVELPGLDPALANAPPPPVGGGQRPGVILPSPIKRANGTAPPPPINSNNPLSYFDVLSGAKANARGLTSASAMRQMAMGFLLYEQANNGPPDTLEQLGQVLGDMTALLNNQRTGDNPGFLYEKPTGGGVQPMVWETIGGQKDPTGAVLMSDGTIR